MVEREFLARSSLEVSDVNDLSKQVSRFQDLSRAQAFGLEARVLQRLIPLLQLSNNAASNDVANYFDSLFDLTYLLAEVALGNQSVEVAKKKGQSFDSALNPNRLFSDKSVPAANAIRCVIDALGDLGQIRYFPRPGLSKRDQLNPGVVMLIYEAAQTLSMIGMLEQVFVHPANVDAKFIFDHKADTEPFLTTSFFSRALWPLPGLYAPDQGMPHAFESVIMEEWRQSLRNLHLSGVIASYDGLLQGMHLVQKNHSAALSEKPVINNNVTINVGNGSSFTGPVVVGENIRVAYDAAASVSKDELRNRLEELVGLVSKLTEAANLGDRKKDTLDQKDVSDQLKSFVDEAKKEKPSRWMLDISSKELLEAAKTVASMAEPITTAVKAVLDLVTPEA